MLRALIISDIHALSRDLHKVSAYNGRTGSKLFVEDRTPDKNCLLAISEAVSGFRTKIDVLLCLGDLAHQAKRSVTMAVWNDIQRVANALSIPVILAVTGNHDIASRPEDFQDEAPSQFLFQLDPQFPSQKPKVASDYRRDSYAVTKIGDACFVLVNTCSLHGYGASNAAEVFNRGHLSEANIATMCKSIASSKAQYYLVLMHHHPRRVDEIADHDYDQLATGEVLIAALARLDIPGMIVHGHKHFVALRQSGISSAAPWLLSASSLAANAYEDMARYFSNQFHLLEIERPTNEEFIRGRVLSWEWATNQWVKSDNEVMRHAVGFGSQKSVAEIAHALSTFVTAGFVSFDDALRAAPDLPYLTAVGVRDLKDQLRRHGIELYSGDFERVSGFFRRI
jgi:predicted MPP superfamily phosphohydrolase